MSEVTACVGCGSPLTGEMVFCPDCGSPRPASPLGSGSRLKGSLADRTRGDEPPIDELRVDEPRLDELSRLRAPSWLFDTPVGPAQVEAARPVGQGPASQPTVVADPEDVGDGEDVVALELPRVPSADITPHGAPGFRFDPSVAHGAAAGSLWLELVDESSVLLRAEEHVVERFLMTVSVLSEGQVLIRSCPTRVVLCTGRLVGIVLAEPGAPTNPCFSLDLATVGTIALVREAKRFGGARDLAVRLTGVPGQGFDVRLESAAVETTGPATYGPPPRPVALREVFDLLGPIAARCVRFRRGASDHWLDAAEQGHVAVVGDDVVAFLIDPAAAPLRDAR